MSALKKGDRVFFNDEAGFFGLNEVHRTGTVRVTPKTVLVLVKIDDGPENYYHESFLTKTNERQHPLTQPPGAST